MRRTRASRARRQGVNRCNLKLTPSPPAAETPPRTGPRPSSSPKATAPAFVLRHWRTEGDKAEPVFVTWLRDVGRFCVRAKYGRYSLRHGEWYVDIGAGHEPAPSPLEQPTAEALLVSEALHGRLKQPAPAWSALAPWPSSTWTATGASSASLGGAAFSCSGTWRATTGDWPTRRRAPGRPTPSVEGPTPVGAGSSRSPGMGSRSASAS